MLALLLGAAPAAADGGWQVVEVAGKVHIRYGADRWVQARAGDTLFSSAEIITGADGRAVLARGPSTIAVAPGARIELPPAADGGELLQKASLPGPDHRPQHAIERVFQSFGTLLYKVKPDSGRQFQVQTPYLVTTIKGTVFTVAVSTTGAAVHVTEGLVEVMPTLGGVGAMVAAGQAAVVPAARGADVEVRGLDAERAPKVYPEGRSAEPAGPAGAGGHEGQEEAARDDGRPSPDSPSSDSPSSDSKDSVVFVNAKGIDENGVAHLPPEALSGGALSGQLDLGLGAARAGSDDRSSAALGIDSLLSPSGDDGSAGAGERDGDGAGAELVLATEGATGGTLNLGGVGDGLGDVAGGVGGTVGGTADGVGDLAGGGAVDLGGVGDGLGGVADGLGGVVDGVGDIASGGTLDLGGVGDGLDATLDGVGGVIDGVGDIASGGTLDLGGVGDGLDATLGGVGGVIDGVGDLASGGALDLGGVGDGLDGTLDGLGGVVEGVGDGVGDLVGGGDSGSGGGLAGALKGLTGSLLN